MKAIEKTLADLPITNADALYERAYALRMGDGVRVNLRAAHRLFMLAALKGKRAAFYQLGLMNMRGEGRPVNRLHAAMWLKLGVGRDEPRAARNLEMVAGELRARKSRRHSRLLLSFLAPLVHSRPLSWKMRQMRWSRWGRHSPKERV